MDYFKLVLNFPFTAYRGVNMHSLNYFLVLIAQREHIIFYFNITWTKKWEINAEIY